MMSIGSRTKRNLSLFANRRERERDVLRACMEYLHAKGYVFVRNNTCCIIIDEGGRKRAIKNGVPGSADLLVCGKDGRFIAIECKNRNGKLTPWQEDFKRRVEANGGTYILATQIEDLMEAGL